MTKLSFTEGIHFGVPMSDYRAAEGISQGNLKEIAISPAHYLSTITEEEDEPTDTQKIGAVTHSILLDNRFDQFVVRPEMYPVQKKGVATGEIRKWSGNAAWCKDWLDEQTVTVIKKSDLKNIQGMIASVQKHPEAARVLYGQGNNEVSCWKRDQETGLLLKCRPDRVAVDKNGLTVIVDLKTCQRGAAADEAFRKEIWDWDYQVQSTFYLDIFEASFFVFIAVEKEAPYAVNTFYLKPDSIALGRRQYRRWLAKVKECTDSGVWPAYGNELKPIDVPDWVLRKNL